MVLDVRVGGGLVEDTVMTVSSTKPGWCWTLGLVEVWWKIQ